MIVRKIKIILFLSFIFIFVKSKKSNINKIQLNQIKQDFFSFISNKTSNIDSETININFNYNINKNQLLISIILITLGILLLSIIYSFWKVPLKKGYACRCCQRTKYFFKGLISLIFLPVTIIYYLINGLFGCLDGVFPDTRLEDCKLDEVDENINQKSNKKNNQFIELNEERP